MPTYHRVFISHAHTDKAICKQYAVTLNILPPAPQSLQAARLTYSSLPARVAADSVTEPNGRQLLSHVTFSSGPLMGQTFVLRQNTTTIGRTAGNDIIIPDVTVSRYHARIFFLSNRRVIEDVQSASGVWLNTARVDRSTPLESGDLLRLGDVHAIFEILN